VTIRVIVLRRHAARYSAGRRKDPPNQYRSPAQVKRHSHYAAEWRVGPLAAGGPARLVPESEGSPTATDPTRWSKRHMRVSWRKACFSRRANPGPGTDHQHHVGDRHPCIKADGFETRPS
jgi:hypothetical protein